MKFTRTLGLLAIATMACGMLAVSEANAAFIVNADTADAGFSFGGDTTSASSSIASAAVGTSGTSLFGGNGSNANGNPFDPATADTYVFTYDLNNADNFSPSAGSLLGSTTGFGTEFASGVVGGVSGTYNVYFTAPASTNVNPLGSLVTISNDGAPVTIAALNENNGSTGADLDPDPAFVGGANNSWLLIGTVDLTAGNSYSVTVAANTNSFVSQRAAAVMWELAIPEPTTGCLLLVASMGMAVIRRKRA